MLETVEDTSESGVADADRTPTIQVRPVEGRRVRVPSTGNPLPDDGGNFPASSYWIRRVNAGDVVIATESAETPKKATRRKRATAEE